MQLTPRELDKLMIHVLAETALKRKARGLKLNHPEAVAVLSAAILNEARSGRTAEEIMVTTCKILTKDDVMEGVADKIPVLEVEATLGGECCCITVHDPIN